MSYIEIILLAFALSIDACIASFSYGLVVNEQKLKTSLKLASVTGLFQGLMPILGFYLANLIKEYIIGYGNILVFLIFTYLGIKIIREAFEKKDLSKLKIKKRNLFLIGIATSIDAFSAGISLSLCGNHILKPSLLIGIITFINSISGFYLGNKLKHLPTKTLEITAGCLLIFLGIRNLL